MAETEQIIGVVVLGLAAMMGLAIFGTLAGVATDMGTSAGSQTLDPTAGESYVLDTAIDDSAQLDLSVSPTREKAIRLDGDGHIDANVSNWATNNSSWSLATTAQLSEDANQQATYNVLGVDNGTILVEYADGSWRAIYYDGNESAIAAVAATDETSLTPLVVRWNETASELTLTTESGSTTGALNTTSPDRHVANNWVGTIDEIRFVNGTISASSTSTYLDDPINPLRFEDHAGRIMFEAGSGNTAEVYYSNATATISGGTWTSGVSAPALEQGTDYRVSVDPLSITVVQGGYLDGSPVAYATWGSGLSGTLSVIINGFGASIELVPIIMLVSLASITVGVIARMRN